MARQKKPRAGASFSSEREDVPLADDPKEAKEKFGKSVKQPPMKRPKKASKKPLPATRRLLITDTTPDVALIPVAKNTLQLALLSPFKYPINYHNVATQTARYAGMFFVVAGAVLMLINIEGLNGYYAEIESRAQTVTATDRCSDPNDSQYDPVLCGTTNTVSSDSGSTGGTTSDLTAALPEVNIILDAPNPDQGYVKQQTDGIDTVRGNIEVRVQVESAERIELYIKDAAGNRTKIGAATLRSANEWALAWNTASAPDGRYDLYAYVTSGQDTYDDGHESIEITNTSSGTGTMYEPPITISFTDSEPLSGETEVHVNVMDAEKVTFFVDGTFIGQAVSSNYEDWKYTLRTTNYKDGTHTLYAKVYLLNGHTYESDRVGF